MKKILISKKAWETRSAVTRNDHLQNIYFASHSKVHLERCFFRGIVTKVLPGIQTAFVEFGQQKAGFLHISEIDHNLALTRMSNTIELDGNSDSSKNTKETKDSNNTKDDNNNKESKDNKSPKTGHRKSSLDISKILKEGEPILVQVSKEPVYEKGAKLTRCFTLPGRFIVLMPNIPRIGISKKIENQEERLRLKEIIKSLLPEGMGAIIRTSSENRDSKELSKDVHYLVNLWNNITKDFESNNKVAVLHTDLPLCLQTVRDHLDDRVESVQTDNKDTYYQILDFVKKIAPEYRSKVKYYSQKQSLFDAHNIESQLDSALEKKEQLRSGGSIIIETTEAMTVVDVNTGKFVGKKDQEATILQTNLEAAEEIVRQLRLRNIGGLIVIDFIDMSISANKQKLFKFFEQNLKEHDKFQSVVLKISDFGLVQMTRKRSGKTLVQQLTSTCSGCHGRGFINSIETDSHSVLRRFDSDLKNNKTKDGKLKDRITLTVNPDVFEHINHLEHNAILELEKKYGCKIVLNSNKTIDRYKFKIQ